MRLAPSAAMKSTSTGSTPNSPSSCYSCGRAFHTGVGITGLSLWWICYRGTFALASLSKAPCWNFPDHLALDSAKMAHLRSSRVQCQHCRGFFTCQYHIASCAGLRHRLVEEQQWTCSILNQQRISPRPLLNVFLPRPWSETNSFAGHR